MAGPKFIPKISGWLHSDYEINATTILGLEFTEVWCAFLENSF
jgi:hypothetical protein